MPDPAHSDALALRKLELLRRRLAPPAAAAPAAAAAAPSGRMSFGQQRLWFLDRLAGGLSLYNIPAGVRVQGELDGTILERAFAEVMRRHEVLRARFDDDQGVPRMAIEAAVPFQLEQRDLCDEADAFAAALHDALGFAARPFNLAHGPLLRACLYRLARTDHLLAISVHHIAADGASVELLIREVTALCLDFRHGRAPSLPALPSSYAAYADWQRGQREAGRFDEQLRHWRRVLEGAAPALTMPADRVDAQGTQRQHQHQGAKLEHLLPKALTPRLAALAAAQGCTLFTLLLCAFQGLVLRHTGSSDIVVGTPVNNRTRPEFGPLIGFFVNSLVLRTQLHGDPSFEQALARTRRTVIDALGHQDLPFELLVQELKPERALARTPLFQLVFSFQPEPPAHQPAPGLDFERVPLQLPLAKFDFSLYVSQREGSLLATAEYDTSLFTEAGVRRWLCHYQTLLQSAAEAPQQPLSRLPMLAPAELPLIEGPAPAPAELHTLAEAFARQCAASPAAPAVQAVDGSLSYAQLDQRASALALRLRAAGLPAGGTVALLLARSTHLLVAVLGVLKAGACYLPLDPEHAPTRLARMLARARPQFALSDSASQPGLPALPQGTALLLVDEPAAAVNAALPPPTPGPAYLMFTSGSTGEPKGVWVGQAALLNVLASLGEALALGPGDRWLAITTAGFDIASLEWLLPLVRGATVVLASGEAARDGAALARRLREDAITVLQATPASWQLLLAAGWKPTPGLKMLCGGEALSAGLARALAGNGARLWNVYGPTETTIWSMLWPVPAEPAAVYLGHPLDHTRVLLLDADGALVPPGTPGEVHIGGAGLAYGYLGLPAQTAERFVPDPYGITPGARLYRTGDLARADAEGRIRFIGRVDGQVKLRGHRIELGEVESALLAFAGVRQAACVLRHTTAGEPGIAAFVVPQGEAPPPAALRLHLQRLLHGPMLPAEIKLLEALPLTPSGKVDRRALAQCYTPPAGVQNMAALADLDEPLQGIEAELAAIWAEVLGRAAVGRHDHFFEVGGHSLLAARVQARIRSLLGVELPLRDLFEAPTLAGLARRISERRHGAALLGDVPLRLPGAPAPDLPSFAQERLYFLARLDPRASHNLVFAAQIAGRLDPARLADCLAELVRRHEVLRTGFVSTEQGPRAPVHAQTGIPLVLQDASGHTGAGWTAALEATARRQASTPFDLEQAPLARAELVFGAGAQCALLVTLHHLVADAVSIEILVRELARLYLGPAAGPPLPALALQYADYAAWQRQQLKMHTLAQQLAYWKQQLAGAATEIEFIADRIDTGADAGGAHLKFELPAATAAALQAHARARGATLFMTLLAAWQAQLARWVGCDDFLIGLPVANRRQAQLEPLVGLFVNTVVLRADLRDDPSFDQLLDRARRNTLAALDHQDLPFESLVQALAPRRDSSRTPLFQTMFMLQHRARGETGSAWQALRLETGVSRFDLTLAINETAGHISAEFEYSRALFEPQTIAAAAAQWLALIDAALAAPSTPLRRLLPVPAASAPPGPPEPGPAPLLQRLLAHALAAPDAPALVGPGETLSRHELLGRVAAGCRALQALGVRPESLVPVLARRDTETLVSLLAVLASGAAYVPIDPEAPAEQRARILRALGARECWAAARCSGTDAQGWLGFEGALPQAAAYLIFTSGSTGRPKGVVVEHRALGHFAEAAIRQYALGPADRVLQFASLGFDASVEEIFPTLAAGATLVLAPEDVRRSTPALLQHCAEHRVTVLDLPTAYWHELVSALADTTLALPPSLRLLIIGGEAARADRLAAWQHLAPQVALFNTYGPTETTVVASAWRATPGWDASRRVPLGEALAGVQLHLLDAQGQPVPANVPGEIFVGGAGLARGYLGDPRATATHFLPDPFAGSPGARMYRSGDRARRTASGALEFIGRLDRQIKLRGFRVEPAEVEAVLAAHPAVEHCALIPACDAAGATRLVAGVVCRGGRQPLVRDLREYLAQRLPAYLVPAAFVFTPAIPLSSTGKVDHTAILALEQAVGGRAAAASGDPLIDLIAGVWADALGCAVGARDDFFALGGHSLLILRVTTALNAALGVQVPLRVLFEAPTPAGVAAWVRTGRQTVQRLPPLLPRSGEAAPLSIAQEQVWRTQRALPAYAGLNIGIAVRIEAALSAQLLADALAELVERHPVLNCQVQDDPAAAPCFVALDVPLDVDFFDLRGSPPGEREATVRGLATHQRRQPIDLRSQPPLRVWLVQLEDEVSALLMALHHIAGDAVSVAILVDELVALYGAQLGLPVRALAPPLLSGADFAAWQRRTLAEGGFAAQLSYWRRTLAPPYAAQAMAQARSQPSSPGFTLQRTRRRVPASRLEALWARARQAQITPFIAVLAVIKALWAHCSGVGEVRLATMTANRSLPGSEGLIGLLANTLVLRTAVPPTLTWRELMQRVRQGVLAAFDNQELPFETLLEALQADGLHDRADLAPMLVLWQADPAPPAAPPDWRASPLFGTDEAGAGVQRLSGFDLVWDCRLEAEGLTVTLSHRSSRYDAQTIDELLAAFERLLAAAAQAGEHPHARQPWPSIAS